MYNRKYSKTPNFLISGIDTRNKDKERGNEMDITNLVIVCLIFIGFGTLIYKAASLIGNHFKFAETLLYLSKQIKQLFQRLFRKLFQK
jgi:hypothetical protein